MSLNGVDRKPGDARNELFSFISTGNALPVLHEVAQKLADLIETGQTAIIDLGAFPFAAGDERILDEVLGTGEVQATLNAMGQSHIQETGIPGVWRVDHFDQTGETQSRFLEITTMPEILKTQAQDAALGLETLLARLAERRGPTRNPEGD
ncbi:MAG: hydrogenase expression/formation protein [Rhodobacteraceae bacterium]|nr:hydrogenase expression/formation protein [Paracoccaceae bacterium]